MRIRDTLSAEFSRLCYYGFWYAPEMELVMNSIDFSQRHVTGAVELKLYKGNTIVMGRESPVALYRSVRSLLLLSINLFLLLFSSPLYYFSSSLFFYSDLFPLFSTIHRYLLIS